MQTYEVIEMFTDAQDNEYRYEAGDFYPRLGLEVSKKRIEELLSDKNLRGRALIKQKSK